MIDDFLHVCFQFSRMFFGRQKSIKTIQNPQNLHGHVQRGSSVPLWRSKDKTVDCLYAPGSGHQTVVWYLGCIKLLSLLRKCDSDMERWELTMFEKEPPLWWVVGLHLDLGDKHWVWFWRNSTFFRKRRWCESLHKHVLLCSVQLLTKQHLSQEALDQTQRHCDYGCPWHRSCRWAIACWASWSKREQNCHVLMARSRWFSQSRKRMQIFYHSNNIVWNLFCDKGGPSFQHLRSKTQLAVKKWLQMASYCDETQVKTTRHILECSWDQNRGTRCKDVGPILIGIGPLRIIDCRLQPAGRSVVSNKQPIDGIWPSRFYS